MVDAVSSQHPDWEQQLRAHGLRVTQVRMAALRFIDAHPHTSAAQLHTALSADNPSASLQTAHNIVHDLTERGMLRRIDLPNGDAARYETRVHDNHHHVQCIVCGRVEDVDCAIGHAPCLTPAQTHGMRILEADVTYRGICAECDAQRAHPTPTTSTPRKDELSNV